MKRKTLAGVTLRPDGSLPPLGGGQDVDELLANLEADIKALKDAKERGESVDEQKLTTLESQLTTVKALISSGEPAPEPELQPEPTKAFDQDAFSKTLSEALAKHFGQAPAPQVQPEPQAEQKQVPVTAGVASHEAIAAAVAEGMKSVFEQIKTPSKALLPGASESSIEDIAKLAESKGLTIVDQSGLRVLEDVEVKAFVSSKEAQFAKLFGMLHRKQQGFMTEFDQRALKAMARGTDAAGGFLVPQQWMDDILGLIRANTVVRAAGPRIIPFAKSMNQTVVSGGATAFYIGENSSITPSEMTFGEVPLLSPKILTGLVPVSNDLLGDAPEVEQMVRDELSEALALREDLAFLEGTGAANQPRGFKNMVGITDLTTALAIPANGGPFLADYIRRMVGRLRTLNVRGARLAFFFHPAILTQLELQKDNDGRYFLENGVLQYTGNGESGTIWGIPFYTSTQIPTNQTRGTSSTATYILLVNMAEAILGINRELVLDSSNEASYLASDGVTWISAYQNRQTLYRAQMSHDINHRRKDQILLVQGIESTA